MKFIDAEAEDKKKVWLNTVRYTSWEHIVSYPSMICYFMEPTVV